MDYKFGQIGRFRIEEESEHNSLYTSYLARDTQNDQTVVLKVANPQVFDTPDLRTEFLDAGDRAATLQHPKIVPTLETGEADDQVFIVGKHVGGVYLSDLLEYRDEPVLPDEVVAIVRQIADALDYAHLNGVLHLNVTPEHVFITEDRQVLLDHFELGMLEQVVGSDQQTAPLQTPLYFRSPEQLRDPKNVDRRADIYSLGVITYLMFTAKPPFDATNQTTLKRQILDELPVPAESVNPNIPLGMVFVLRSVLSKEPNVRYSSAGEFADALIEGHTWTYSDTAEEAAHTGAAQTGAAPRRRRAALIVTGTFVLIVLALLGLLASNPDLPERIARLAGDTVLPQSTIVGLASSSVTPTAEDTQGEGAQNSAEESTSPANEIIAMSTTNTATPIDTVTTAPATATATPAPTRTPTATTTTAPTATHTAVPTIAASPTAGDQGESAQTGAAVSTDAAPAADDATAAPTVTPEATGAAQALILLPTPTPDERPASRDPATTIPMTATQQPTSSPTALPTDTVTPLPTATNTEPPPTQRPTATVTPRPTSTNTLPPPSTATATRQPTATPTPRPSPTDTPPPTATHTASPQPTPTPRPSATFTPRPSATATRTPRPASTATPRPTATRTLPPQSTPTPRPSATFTPRPSATGTRTPRPAPTATPRPTATRTTPPQPTPTPRPTATLTPRPTATATNTLQPTSTAIPLPTSTATIPPPTATPRPTSTATNTPAPTAIPVNSQLLTLVTPGEGQGSGGEVLFEWQTTIVPGENQAFELVLWPVGESAMSTGFGLAAPTLSNRVIADLDKLDQTLGTLLEPGEYNWGLLLVQIEPYSRIQFLGAQRAFVYVRNSSSSGGPTSGE